METKPLLLSDTTIFTYLLTACTQKHKMYHVFCFSFSLCYASPQMTVQTTLNYCFPKDIQNLTPVCHKTTPSNSTGASQNHKRMASHLPFLIDQPTSTTPRPSFQAVSPTGFTQIWKKNTPRRSLHSPHLAIIYYCIIVNHIKWYLFGHDFFHS